MCERKISKGRSTYQICQTLVGDIMPKEEEDGIELIFSRPREEGGSLVITIPKHVCDKLRIKKGSTLHLILYSSFVVLRQKGNIDYDQKPMPEILKLLDKVFELFKEKRELETLRYFEKKIDHATFETRMEEIFDTLKDTSTKIFTLLEKKRPSPQLLTFGGEFESPEEILETLQDIYQQYYEKH
jgi:antitoxin component of MazEF toxin-antitoxin module